MATESLDLWDARAEVALGQFIRRYLNECPPPEGSRLAGDMEDYMRGLLADGEARLDELGARRLEPAETFCGSGVPLTPEAVSGRKVLREILELLIRRVPALAANDPVRPHLASLLPNLAESLGEARVAVTEER